MKSKKKEKRKQKNVNSSSSLLIGLVAGYMLRDLTDGLIKEYIASRGVSTTVIYNVARKRQHNKTKRK